jgi:hypothetical protein
MEVDYSSLPDDLTGLNHDEAKKATDQLNKKLVDLHNLLVKIQAPNMKANQKLETAREKLLETNEEFDSARKRAKAAKLAFEKVKNERHRKFMLCYDHVASSIDGIYKVSCCSENFVIYNFTFFSPTNVLYIILGTGSKPVRPSNSWTRKPGGAVLRRNKL